MTNYAQFVAKKVPLASEFGEKFARRIFGDDDIDDLPVYVRGPKKGQKKGWLVWVRAEKGGWVREGNYYDKPVGYVASRGHYLTVAVEIDHRAVLEATASRDGKFYFVSRESQKCA
jgi:hypothetical protein